VPFLSDLWRCCEGIKNIMHWNEKYARRARGLTGSAIRELLKLTEQPDFISLAGGLPAPESFPVAEIAAAAAAILRDRGPQALQYGATEGYRPLRELIARRTSTADYTLTAENVLITSGSQQALDLLGKVFLDVGDRVLLESPTYLAALQAWNAYEVGYIDLPMDEEGLDPDALEPALRQEPKFLYCVPNFHNPTGVTLSLARRQRLVALAAVHGLPLVEDDPYGALRFEGEALPSLLTVAGAAGGVIQLSTFSKTLAPGLRVGWVVAPAEVIGRMALAKQGTDLHTGTLDQYIVHELLGSGQIEAGLPAIVARYRERRDTMLAALAEHFPAGVHWTRPTGGMFLWVTLPRGIDASELLPAAVERGVAFVPGKSFFPNGGGESTMRLNFSNASPERIREGIARLGSLLREY
jgi:2-aminoadipate transaminase